VVVDGGMDGIDLCLPLVLLLGFGEGWMANYEVVDGDEI
jgi:hypothetical protein